MKYLAALKNGLHHISIGDPIFQPVAFLSIIYFKIGKELLARKNRFILINARNQMQQQSITGLHQHLKTGNAKPLLVSYTIVACFIFSGLPIQLTWIICISASKEIPSYSLLLESLCIFGSAVINPYVYRALNKKVFSFFQHCQMKLKG